jgi:PHD/YefM family antitoxin component YafN of YafNO toxin-antitoxin module
MSIYSTNEARSKFAEIIDIIRREPVAIAKHERIVLVILVKEDYEHYQAIEEEQWMNYKTVPAEDATDRINARIEKLEQKLLDA